jgi:hypothetical protein
MPKPRAGTNRYAVRNEMFFRMPITDGTIRTFILRDSIAVEDPYLKLVRAKLYSILTGEEFAANLTSRQVKDDLIKVNIQI